MKELLLIKWSNDHYPPIDLNKKVSAVVDLITEVKELRKINEKLLNASESAKSLVDCCQEEVKMSQNIWDETQSELNTAIALAKEDRNPLEV